MSSGSGDPCPRLLVGEWGRIFMRLVLIIMMSTILTLTTRPLELTGWD